MISTSKHILQLSKQSISGKTHPIWGTIVYRIPGFQKPDFQSLPLTEYRPTIQYYQFYYVLFPDLWEKKLQNTQRGETLLFCPVFSGGHHGSDDPAPNVWTCEQRPVRTAALRVKKIKFLLGPCFFGGEAFICSTVKLHITNIRNFQTSTFAKSRWDKSLGPV